MHDYRYKMIKFRSCGIVKGLVRKKAWGAKGAKTPAFASEKSAAKLMLCRGLFGGWNRKKAWGAKGAWGFA